MSHISDPYWGLPDPDSHAEFYANVPTKRFVAWIFDMIVILVLSLLAVPFTAFTAIFFLPALSVLVAFAYRTVTLARGSATWGMRLVSIEMRNARGERLDTATAAIHTLIYSASLALVLPQLVSIILMLTGARAQGLGDHILGTAAINRPATT
ncbi:RDD family protein [Rhodovulum sp. P5]|uniref:RDD family protein n=1 Tax=Rhodovulum sp. P5 TaxID=1564506 RepID=UPI0009C35E99|nr:RDD family protein [Rhodovulum sp. P5]ARE41998.1 RDD family protein [Rhodovulum sp. P5]